MTLPNKGLQVAHQHAGETKSREIWEYLFRRLNTRPKEGEGWLVGERRDTLFYALKSSKSRLFSGPQHIERHLAGKQYRTDDEVISAIQDFIEDHGESFYTTGIQVLQHW